MNDLMRAVFLTPAGLKWSIVNRDTDKGVSPSEKEFNGKRFRAARWH